MRFLTISCKGRQTITFIIIYFAYLIQHEWWIMKFSIISHKGRQVAILIIIYFAYLILDEW